MEESQPLKKRIMEQPSSNISQRIYARSCNIQRQAELGQQEQNEQNLQPQQNQLRQPMHENYPQQQQQPEGDHRQQIHAVPQKVHIHCCERPMTLTVWTQTQPDEFPEKVKPQIQVDLEAKVKQLAAYVQFQNDFIEELRSKNTTISSSPQRIVSSPIPIISSETKPEVTTYRILTELELSEEMEVGDLDTSSTTVYTLQTSPPTIVDHIHNQKVGEPILRVLDKETSMVSIGPNNTKILATEFDRICWTSASIATRKLLTLIFDRETLATHSMTGKASPAFKDLDKPIKGKLDPNAIQDIVHIVTTKCGVSTKEVRSAITTKCADENKMLKLKSLKRMSLQVQKRSALTEINKRQSQISCKENT